MEFEAEAAFAGDVARGAGELLLGLRTGRAPGKELGDDGDRQSQAFIAKELSRAYPADAVLSEEAADDKVRLRSERVWIVDPLDGTREYSEGRHDWAVHVAFWHAGELAGGAVALPARGLTLSALDKPSATGPMPDRPRIVVSRTRPPDVAGRVAEALGGELTGMGSSGYKAMSVVLGEAEAYIHAGGQYEWDLAAPAAVALAAGLHVSRIDGSPLRFNQENPWMPDVVICRPELAERILAVTRR